MKDVFIVAAKRLPLVDCSRPPDPSRGLGWQKGLYHEIEPAILASMCAKGILDSLSGFDPNLLTNIFWGCANPVETQNGNLGRLIAIANKWRVPGLTINQFCMSSMSCQHFASAYLSSELVNPKKKPLVILVGGVEHMSRIPMAKIFEDLSKSMIEFLGPEAMSMGYTAEQLASLYGITREMVDAWAVLENQRARAAIMNGDFKNEIIPVFYDSQEVMQDTLPDELTVETIQKKGKKFFDAKKGILTQYTSSKMTDGSAGLIFCNQEALDEYHWQPLARVIGIATGEVEPELMGAGVIDAAKKFFETYDMKPNDFGVQEINTAFVPVPLSYMKHFDVPESVVNLRGGATALGHPLGATGARLVVTGINIAKDLRQKYLLANMCVGWGMGGLGAYEVFF